MSVDMTQRATPLKVLLLSLFACDAVTNAKHGAMSYSDALKLERRCLLLLAFVSLALLLLGAATLAIKYGL